jgi:transposase
MAPSFVKPYVKTNKNDRNDAEAICEAVTRPNMRFVPIKSAEQQGLLALHCARSGWVKARTAQANQIRGLLSEFGIVMSLGIARLSCALPDILEDGANGLPSSMRALLSTLLAHLKELDQQIQQLEREIVLWHRRNEDSCRLQRIRGIGPITASALVASIGDAKNFKNGRQVAAWLGLVPAQDSSGGKTKLLGTCRLHLLGDQPGHWTR